ncbi:methionine adenosyltransferase [bacterium]|nr:methionine adenosyltransferase [bacterium]
MEERNYIFTSESVSEGHPDKVADQISDAILDAFLKEDPTSRVAVETLITTGLVVISGEITSKAYIEMKDIARKVVSNIGYTSSKIGFDGETCGVLLSIDSQSGDIAMGVDSSEKKEQGAGDQGIMFGYATDETEVYMPMPIYYSHKLVEYLAKVRKRGDVSFLRPDAKSQVSVYYENDEPKYITSVVISTQHDDDVSSKRLEEYVIEDVIKKVIPSNLLTSETKFYVNPTGRFVEGGPKADTGLTGRKIIVDTYGGMGRHGGGAFSGKDPSKVDRSAAYMMRYIAKNLVAAGLAKRVELQVSYAIGVAFPISVMVNSFGTSKLGDNRLSEIVTKEFDLRPASIIKTLDLLRPIYNKTAAYGHFGRECEEFTWEKTDRVEDLKKYLA